MRCSLHGVANDASRDMSIDRSERISTVLQVKHRGGFDETRQQCALSATQGWNGLLPWGYVLVALQAEGPVGAGVRGDDSR